MNLGLILFAVLLSLDSLQAQELGQQVIISNSIGDTLRPAMRNHFGLLEGISGFRWALFYLHDDSILNVKVHYMRAGVQADSVIPGYGTLTSVHSALTSRVKEKLDSARVLMKDGTLVGGTIIGQTWNAVIMRTNHLGVLEIPRAQVDKINRYIPFESVGQHWPFQDPNYTRAFIMPTANTPPAGQGYVGDYELIFLNGAVGVTDWLMINAGTLIIPVSIENMVFDYGFKARLSDGHGSLNAAVGLQMYSWPGVDGSGGLAYMVVSVGDLDQKVNFGLGDAFESRGNSALALGISGDYRVSESIKLMGELWYPENSKWFPLILGVRFMGSRLSGDLGMMYPVGASLGSPFGIPVASISYAF